MNSDPVRAHLHHMSMRGLARDTTISSRQQVLARLQEFLDVPLADATADDLSAWRASLTVSSGTIAGYVSHVRMFYAWCLARGYTDSDPAADLPIPKTPRRYPRPISEASLMEAVDCAPRRVRPWLVLAGWCGLRAKEIALLRGENIQLHADPPYVLVASDATKGVRERIIPVSGFVAAELEAAALPVRGLAFRKFDGQPMPANLVSKLANAHLHDYGIPDTLHQLRHRFLTQAHHVSKNIRVVQELAGHAYLSSTAIYTAMDQVEAAAAVNGLPIPA